MEGCMGQSDGREGGGEMEGREGWEGREGSKREMEGIYRNWRDGASRNPNNA
jgi:hypothetical protein